MTTPTTPISFSDIQTEFGGNNPISLSEYYKGGGYVPSSQSYGGGYGSMSIGGAIEMYNFRNKQKFVSGSHGFDTVGTTGWVVPSYVGAINIRAVGGGGGGGGGSARSGRQSPQEAVGAGGGGGCATVYQTTVAVEPGSTIWVVVGGGGGAGGARDGTYSAGSSGGAGSHSGVLTPSQGAWHILSYGAAGGQVGQDNARSAGGVRGADRAAGVGTIYNYAGGGGGQGKNDGATTTTTVDGKNGSTTTTTYTYNTQGGLGAYGVNIWGDTVGNSGPGGSFNDGHVIGDRGYATAVTSPDYGGGGGGGSGGNRGGSPYYNGAAGQKGCVVIWY